MNKKSARMRGKKQQNPGLCWVFASGLVFVFAAVLWLVFSNRQPGNDGARPISRLTTNDFHSLVFSPTEPEVVFFGHHDGLLVSRNGGKDWQPASLSNADAMALAAPPSDPQIMYAAGHDIFYKSTDGGGTWKSIQTNLPGRDIHGFAADPENANHVYAHVVGFGIFGSGDGGKTWALLSLQAPPSTFNLMVGGNAETLYAAAGPAGLWQSIDGGQRWSMLNEAPDEGAIALAYIRANHRLYLTTLGSDAGMYYSEDGGKIWESAGLQGTFLAVAVSPLDPSHIIAVNDQGEVFASRDNGLSWSGE